MHLAKRISKNKIFISIYITKYMYQYKFCVLRTVHVQSSQQEHYAWTYIYGSQQLLTWPTKSYLLFLRAHYWIHFVHRQKCTILSKGWSVLLPWIQTCYLKNLKLFSIRVKELISAYKFVNKKLMDFCSF